MRPLAAIELPPAEDAMGTDERPGVGIAESAQSCAREIDGRLSSHAG